MIKSEVLFNSYIDQTIVATPSVGVNDVFGGNFAEDKSLQHGFTDVWDDLCVHAATALEQFKYDCFSPSSATSFAANALSSEVGLISLKLALKRELSRTKLRHARTNALEDGVDTDNRQTSKLRNIRGSLINSKEANKLSKLGFVDFGVTVIPVFPIHFVVNMFRKHFCFHSS
jgi:hypothetical protein